MMCEMHKQKNGNCLYVSDLDGTLMKNDGTLSEYTIQTINELVERGMFFTFATARSIESARVITEKLKLQLPVIRDFIPKEYQKTILADVHATAAQKLYYQESFCLALKYQVKSLGYKFNTDVFLDFIKHDCIYILKKMHLLKVLRRIKRFFFRK